MLTFSVGLASPRLLRPRKPRVCSAVIDGRPVLETRRCPRCGVWPGAWIGHYATSWRRFRCSPPSSSRPTSRPYTTPYREGCAALPLGSRRVYVPLYAAGVPLLRSLVWNVVTLGIVLLVVALLLG